MATTPSMDKHTAGVGRVYDEIAADYDERVLGEGPVEARFSSTESAFILDRIAPTDAVLDVGCGTCRVTIPIARTGATVTGLDISEGMIAEGREKLRDHGVSAELTAGSMCQMPFADASFDVVVSMLALMHIDIPDRKRVFSELARVLKPGGTLLIGVKNALIERLMAVDRIATVDVTDLSTKELVFTERRDGASDLRAAWHSFSPTELKRLCAQSGLQPVRLVGNLSFAAWIADRLLEDERIGATVDTLESLLGEVSPFNELGYHLLLEAAKPATSH